MAHCAQPLRHPSRGLNISEPHAFCPLCGFKKWFEDDWSFYTDDGVFGDDPRGCHSVTTCFFLIM